MTYSNLAPGVRESDLPGNRPEDLEAQRFAENLTEDDLLGYIEDEIVGDLIYLVGPYKWGVESETGDVLSFDTKYDCISYVLCERWDWIEEKLIEKHAEELIDGAYDVGGEEY